MLESLLRALAVISSVLVLLGFAFFAVDQASGASRRSQAELAGEDPAPQPDAERQREGGHSSVREAIDDADDVLLSPFAGVVSSSDGWIRRLVPTALALLVYGLGLGFLARFARGRS